MCVIKVFLRLVYIVPHFVRANREILIIIISILSAKRTICHQKSIDKQKRRERNCVCKFNCLIMSTRSIADYYWRDYTGQVPDDAIPGGHDLSGRPTYIGQCFFPNLGVFPGTIYPNKPGINLPCDGNAELCEVGIKILCSGNPNNLEWENASSHNLHLTTIGKHLVIGGCQDEKIINIGRASYQGELIVGKVLGYNIENTKLYFIHENKEIVLSSFQVLICNRIN